MRHFIRQHSLMVLAALVWAAILYMLGAIKESLRREHKELLEQTQAFDDSFTCEPYNRTTEERKQYEAYFNRNSK